MTCVNVTYAQRAWEVESDLATEILPGEDHYYVIQEGIQTSWGNQNRYINSNPDKTETLSTACIYSFIQVDEKIVEGEKFPIYVLKNVANNMYLEGPQSYVRSKLDAFRFTARKAKFNDQVGDGTPWIEYSNAVNVANKDAETNGQWILCSPDARTYIGYWKNPSISGYTDTNDLFIKVAKERELPASEKFYVIYDKYIGKGMVDLETYPVGDAPGCISQDVFDEMLAAYNLAQAALQGSLSDAEYDAAREAIEKAWARCEKERVMVGSGYYLLVNGRSQDMAYDNGEVGKCWNGHAAPDAWTVENAKFIWQVVETGEDDKFVLKNWGTGRYLGLSEDTSRPYKMVSDSTITYTAPHYKSQWFLLKSQDGNHAHNDASGTIVLWNSTGEGNWWRFNPVPVDTIAKLSVAVKQNVLNNNLSELVKTAKSDVLGVQTESGWTDDASFAAAGLVTEATTNAPEGEGPVDRLFDGKLNTFFHSSWSKDPGHDDYHWVQVDLGHAVKNLYIKMAERHNNQRNSATKAKIFGIAGDDIEAGDEAWAEELASIDTIVYDLADSMVYVGKIELAREARYIRFAVTHTITMAAQSGHPDKPFWSCAEMRFFDGDQSAENPLYASVPQAIKDALKAAIEKAEAEVAAGAATQETIDALETALENFWEAYPDPEALTDKLEAMEKLVNAAQEDVEKLGYFQEGAKQPMLEKITELKEKVTKNSTAAELEAIEKELDEAFAAFNGKLNVPADQTICRIQSTASALFDNGNKRPQHKAAICSANADSTGTPVWGYGQDGEGIIADKADRFNTLWLVEKSDEGFAFRNLANGFYMDNKYEGLTKEEIKKLDFSALGYSLTPKHFQLETAGEPGSFVIVMKENEYVNLQPTGNVVHYSVRTDAHAPFEFVVVPEDDEDFYENRIDAVAGAPQIVALPYAVEGVFFESEEETAGFYKLDGTFEGKLQFSRYDSEVIPAGTPVLVVTPKLVGENQPYDFFNAPIAFDSDVKALEYVYKPVKQNGMISAPKGFEIEPGFGIIYNGEVVISEGGEDILSGSGFFNNEVPAVEAASEYQLVLNGEINGAGTAVENVELVKNVANDVYTISGVKVRSNVKTSVATKNLPKGIYIVGGKKVVVK